MKLTEEIEEFKEVMKETFDSNIDDLCEFCRENFAWSDELDDELVLMFYKVFDCGRDYEKEKGGKK